MKRLASILALVVGIAGTTAGTAGAPDNTNVGVQLASIEQKADAFAPAVQYGGGTFSTNQNSSYASATNAAAIVQVLSQSIAPTPQR
jgi:hypothetical protein